MKCFKNYSSLLKVSRSIVTTVVIILAEVFPSNALILQPCGTHFQSLIVVLKIFISVC